MAVAQRNAATLQVYVNGRLSPDVHCLDVSMGQGASGLPMATLEVETIARKDGRRKLEGLSLAKFNQATVEVVANGKPVHFGKALMQHGSIQPNGDSSRLVSKLDKHLFGIPLSFAWYYDPKRDDFALFSLPTIFNPDFDGRNKGNMSDKRRSGAPVFVHEGSTETIESAIVNKTFERFWTLPHAVNYLCQALNGSETYVKNPKPADLIKTLPGSESLLRNVEMPIGEYLPELLDRLLSPFGFGWTVEFEGRGGNRRRIVVYPRQQGDPFPLDLQKAGASVDMSKSSLETLNLTADVATSAFNEVAIFGDYEHYEATFSLAKGWPESLDATDESLLTKNHDGWKTNTALADVWRKWVLNEAGDYNGTRPEIFEPYDLNGIFGPGNYVPRRRKFEPCISVFGDNSPLGHTGGIYVEWYDADAAAWKPIDELGTECRQVRMLEHECGIRFDGLTIPIEIKQSGTLVGSLAAVRVTATIVSDKRLFVFVSRKDASLLKDQKAEVIDAGSRYKLRKRHASSIFAALKGTDVDDTGKMQTLAGQLLDSWNTASIDGTATISLTADTAIAGWVGRTVAGVPGRGVDFNTSPKAEKYPTVVGVKANFENCTLTFTLDTYRGKSL